MVTSHRSAMPAHITGHSSRTLFVREDVHVTSNVELRNYVRLLLNVELRNYVRLLLNVELRNYVISRQIVERRVT